MVKSLQTRFWEKKIHQLQEIVMEKNPSMTKNTASSKEFNSPYAVTSEILFLWKTIAAHMAKLRNVDVKMHRIFAQVFLATKAFPFRSTENEVMPINFEMTWNGSTMW